MENQELKSVTFRAYDKRQQPVVCQPLQDRSGKLYTGQGKTGYYESLSENEKREMGYIIDHFTRVVITDGKTLDLENDAVDIANWKWIQKHPYISLDMSAGKSSRDAVYYVENKFKEAEIRISNTKMKDKARYIIQYELSLHALRHLAKALGNMAADSFHEIELKDWLLQLADNAPDAVCFHADPKNSKASNIKILFNELTKWNIIRKHTGGIFRFGGDQGVFIGRDEDGVIEFLLDEKNIETVAAIQRELEVRKAGA